MTIQAHDQLEEREQQLDDFHHQLKQLRSDANDAIEQLHYKGLDYSYEQGVFDTLRRLQDLFELTFQKEEY